MRLVWLALIACSTVAAAQSPAPLPPAGETAAPDYGRAEAWLCRPGRAGDACDVPLDAARFDAGGRRGAAPFVAARRPAVDCFYVYPTVSTDPTLYSDMAPGTAEEARAAAAQAARFRSVCRLFAPTYRSLTLTGLRAALGGATLPPLDRGRNYDDVRAAWRTYLARDNGGRGVVLIGHSQGAILLKRLIAEEIDGKPAQRLLVSALLAGNPDLTVARGSDRGGSFKAVPLCRSATQAGCVVAWSSYAAEDAAPNRLFGAGGARPDEEAACVNPASSGGGRAPLHGFVARPAAAPASDPPFVAQDGQLAGACVADAGGAVLRVSVEPGPAAAAVRAGLGEIRLPPGWGLHTADISLVQGDLIALVERQAATWAKSRR